MSLNKVPTLHEFIRLVQSIPYVHSRYSFKLTEYFLKLDENEYLNFFKKFQELRFKLEICSDCNAWKEKNDDCVWCGKMRSDNELCVVESWIDAAVLERSGVFKGQYHILGGAISPLDGITPDLLNFQTLIKKLKNNVQIKEVIISTNQTPEGDATASYLERLINQNKINVIISFPASGIPVGTNLEYVDKVTINKAFLNKRKSNF
jgi:recombination protein RecR